MKQKSGRLLEKIASDEQPATETMDRGRLLLLLVLAGLLLFFVLVMVAVVIMSGH